MSELSPETAAFIERLARDDSLSPEDAAWMRSFAEWATPERLEFLLGVTKKVANSLLPVEWVSLPSDDSGLDESSSTDSTAKQLMAQPGFVMLREVATGRSSTSDPGWAAPRFPDEQVVHFCRLWALIETGQMPPQIWELVRVVGEAEDRLKIDAQAADALHVAMAQLDAAMEGWISQDEQLESFVSTLYLLLVTDDEDEALKLDPNLEAAVRAEYSRSDGTVESARLVHADVLSTVLPLSVTP